MCDPAVTRRRSVSDQPTDAPGRDLRRIRPVAHRREMDQRSAAATGRAARVAAARSTVRRSHHACGRTRRARSQVASSRLAPMLMVPMRLSTNHSSSASPPGDEYSLRALFRNARGSVCRYPRAGTAEARRPGHTSRRADRRSRHKSRTRLGRLPNVPGSGARRQASRPAGRPASLEAAF